MSLLHLLGEEEIREDHLQEYFEDLYRVVCVSERPSSEMVGGGLVRTTYIVDWEQLVHLLEDYGGFGEDIVELSRVTGEEARMWRTSGAAPKVARA
jgi:hypothetical protein